MNRGKLIILFYFLAFLSFAFVDFVNLFAGGSCSYTVDEGAGDGGECFYFCPHSPQQCDFFAMTATALFTNGCRKCCMLSAGRDVASVKGRKGKKISAQFSVFIFLGHQRATFVLLLAFFSSQLRGTFIFFFKQRLSKETALLGLSI